MVQTDRQTSLSPLDYHYNVVEFSRYTPHCKTHAVGTSWVRIAIFCSNGFKEKTVFIAFLCPDDRISRPWSDGYVFCIETQATWVRIPILAYFLAVQNAIQSDRN